MSNYERVAVYFASGTGNSYRVAAWFHEVCLEKNLLSELIPYNQAEPKKELTGSRRRLMALAFPTHGVLPPWSVIKFLFRLPGGKSAEFLCLPTRGSLYVGPLFVPGAAGLASFLPSLLLLLKGYRAKGAVSFDMPVNITSIHPPLTAKHAGRVIAKAERKARRDFDRFFRSGSLWLTWNNLYELIWSLLVLYFIPLFPVLYLLVGRLYMGKTLFASHRCVGCGTCADSCSAGALVMKDPEPRRPYWRYNCEFCLRCLNYCPRHAVIMGHSWAVILWWIGVSVAGGGYLFARLTGLVPQIQIFRNYWTVELLNAVFYFPAWLAAYFLFFYMTRFKPLNRLFFYTSFSPLLGQYREPHTALKDLTRRDI